MKNGGSFHSYVSLPEGMFNIFNMLSLSMHHSRIEGGFSEGAEVRRASLLLGSVPRPPPSSRSDGATPGVRRGGGARWGPWGPEGPQGSTGYC